MLYSSKSYTSSRNALNKDLVRKHIASLLKSSSTHRWYKNFRIQTAETDSEIMEVFKMTNSLSKAKKLLPKQLDIDDLTMNTKQHMKEFYRALGREKFASHIDSLYYLK